MVKIDGDRLMKDLRKLATFGKLGTGVDRTAFSPQDMQARQWLRDRMIDSGLDAYIDNVGNVFGASPTGGSKIVMGSHTDSVPQGGWLDGAMGVIYGLEISRALVESGATEGGVDVIAFQDEEGAYLPCLGSRTFCGELADEEIDAAMNGRGHPLREAMAAYDLAERGAAQLKPGRHTAYLEAHIEQGPRLEAENKRIGIVTAIVGIRRFRLSFTGQADHAGTTPMVMRKDAGAALIDVAYKLQSDFRRLAAENTVWNLGDAVFEPGAPNVVPARAVLSVEFRDTSSQVLDRLEARLRELADQAMAGPVSVDAAKVVSLKPTPMDSNLGDRIATAAATHEAAWIRMPSGAGHDAMVLGRHMPTAMMFVPSIGGRSHDIAEDTEEADIVLGCRVLATAVKSILSGAVDGR